MFADVSLVKIYVSKRSSGGKITTIYRDSAEADPERGIGYYHRWA